MTVILNPQLQVAFDAAKEKRRADRLRWTEPELWFQDGWYSASNSMIAAMAGMGEKAVADFDREMIDRGLSDPKEFSWFSFRLWRFMLGCDAANRARLALVFPEHAQVLDEWEHNANPGARIDAPMPARPHYVALSEFDVQTLIDALDDSLQDQNLPGKDRDAIIALRNRIAKA